MERRLLSIREMEEYIGLKRRAIIEFGNKHGFIVRIGGRIMFDRKKVDEWLEKGEEECS